MSQSSDATILLVAHRAEAETTGEWATRRTPQQINDIITAVSALRPQGLAVRLESHNTIPAGAFEGNQPDPEKLRLLPQFRSQAINLVFWRGNHEHSLIGFPHLGLLLVPDGLGVDEAGAIAGCLNSWPELPPQISPPLTLPIKLHLVRNPKNGSKSSRVDAAQIVAQVNEIWQPAQIRIEATIVETEVSEEALEQAYPNNAGEVTTRKPLCSGIKAAPGYQSDMINIYLLRQLPCVGSTLVLSFMNYDAARIGLVAEDYPKASCPKGMAICLGHLLGLTWNTSGDADFLTTPRTDGKRLHPQDVDLARSGLSKLLQAPPAPPPPVITPTLTVPVRIHLVRHASNGALKSRESFLSLMESVNAIWKQAGITFPLVSCAPLELHEEVLKLAYPNEPDVPTTRVPSCLGLTTVTGYDSKTINLFVVQKVHRIGGNATQSSQQFPGAKLAMVMESPLSIPAEKAFAMTLGILLGLSWVNGGPPNNLTSTRVPGTELTRDEILKAREKAAQWSTWAPTPAGATAPSNDFRVVQAPDDDTLEKALTDLDAMVGLTTVKTRLRSLANFLKIEALRRDKGKSGEPMTLHSVLLGAPGTGKTSVARLMGRLLKGVGALKKGHTVETDRSLLIGESSLRTAQRVNEALDLARDGVLFVDEAYSLFLNAQDVQGSTVLTTLVKRMEEDRERVAVIMAGYEDEMLQMLSSNSGLQSRIRHHLRFPDYTPDELATIFHSLAEQRSFTLNPLAGKRVADLMQSVWRERDRTFGNGRLVRNLFEAALEMQADRLVTLPEVKEDDLFSLTEEDIPARTPSHWQGLNEKRFGDSAAIQVTEPPPEDNLEKILGEVEALVGLTQVKKQFRVLTDFFRIEKRRHDEGLSSNPISLHMVFSGPPGTGKTTVARLMGRLFKALDLLARGQVVETDRSGLVAGWVGQTALKTNETINRATQGVLFIDEAHNLLEAEGGQHNWGKEALNTLLKRMEDGKGTFAVVAAGYPDELETLLSDNPGFQSRFNHRLNFEHYNPDELLQIFDYLCLQRGFTSETQAQDRLHQLLFKLHRDRDESFGNGRLVRNLFERALERQATRIALSADSPTSLTLLAAEDIPEDGGERKTTRRIGIRQS